MHLDLKGLATAKSENISEEEGAKKIKRNGKLDDMQYFLLFSQTKVNTRFKFVLQKLLDPFLRVDTSI